METANTVIVDSLQELLVQASESPIEADEAQTAIRYLNRMMAKFDAQGISLGYTAVSSLADPITVPDGAIDGMIANLAMRLAPQYQKPVTQEIAMAARDGKKAMLKLSVTILPTSYPDRLPQGSGNTGDSLYTNTFYPTSDGDVLNETGGIIATEIDTELP